MLTSVLEASSSRVKMVQFGCTERRQNTQYSTTTNSRMLQMSSWALYSRKQPTSSPIQVRRPHLLQIRLIRIPRSPTVSRPTVRRHGVFVSSTAPTSSNMVPVYTASSRTGALLIVLLRKIVKSIWWIFKTRVTFTCGHWVQWERRI